ncbi:formyltetrahydrofolate deformylase [Baekduia alba]|uniref:formyltetrahydrofolate deformylase n=1 Tax=Baekduia alba TaxID=2997333 RepID=UPI0032C42948
MPATAVTMRLLVSCPDRPGIVAAVSRFLFDSGANIVRSDQYSTDPVDGTFFLRMEFQLAPERREGFAERFGLGVADRFDMTWRLWEASQRKRIAVLVSRYDHCLVDLLYRWQRGELDAELVLVASNHEDFRGLVEATGLPFHHVPVTKGDKPEAEAQLLELLDGRCDLVVLARYMQILSGDFLDRVGVPVINIHHSFLPAFAGAGPYERAKERGVKLVGATAHYVTEELDAGPIIEQDVVRVSHADDVASLVRQGAEVERGVLGRAVQWHCQDRVLRHGNTTVVF